MANVTTYTIEGEWSGHCSYQQRVVYREFTTDKKFAESVRKLGWIECYDGTRLELRVIAGRHGKEMSGYNSLIRKCLSQGTNRAVEVPY